MKTNWVLIAMTTSFTLMLSLNIHSYGFHENLGIDDNKASQLYQTNPNDPAIVRWKSALQSTEADLSDSQIITQNSRTLLRMGDMAKQCTDRFKSDLSFISICDSLIQKFNIDVGKLFVENQKEIEKIIYPYTLPSSIRTFTGLNSTSVLGSNNGTVLSEHTSISIQYLETLFDLDNVCGSGASLGDISGITPCLSLMKS